MVDVWGQIFWDHFTGRSESHVIERDDGLIDTFESAESYFCAPRSNAERELLDRLDGPVLDLGAGAGSYALYLQGRGLEVKVGDASPLAVEVCRERGCADAAIMDVRSLQLAPASFQSIIIMGNTVGVHQTPETLPGFLGALHQAVRPDGQLLCAMLDPLDTGDGAHLAYHRRNRAAGRPPGLTRIRLRYRAWVDDWADFWLPTAEEFAAATSAAGWSLIEERSDGPNRVRLYTAA